MTQTRTSEPRQPEPYLRTAREQLSEARKKLADFDRLPAEEVQRLAQGLRQTSQILETSSQIQFGGVSLRKRCAVTARDQQHWQAGPS
ncbi:hypothetical protein DYH09_17215 [bacterium CPR1]|nr:hypothetical protein [bacterium CPR1]